MKTVGTTTTFLFALLLSSSFCSSYHPSVRKHHEAIKGVARNKLDLCPVCINFTSETINELLNIILNAGVIESCAKLCGILEQKTGSETIGVVCNILCDVEGVETFIKLVDKADLDPFYLCELLKQCPVFDNGDAVITGLSVQPQSGPQGQKTINLEFVSKNGTGVGELVFSVKTVDGIPVYGAFIEEGRKPGSYQGTFHLEAVPDPSCDPAQEPCEMWLPGNYTIICEICNGECGSKHPHSTIYDHKTTSFIITQD